MRYFISLSPDDGRLAIVLKMVYLVPLAAICYFPIALYEGMLKIGNPFKGFFGIWKEAGRKND